MQNTFKIRNGKINWGRWIHYPPLTQPAPHSLSPPTNAPRIIPCMARLAKPSPSSNRYPTITRTPPGIRLALARHSPVKHAIILNLSALREPMEECAEASVIGEVVKREPACIAEEHVELGRQAECELAFVCELGVADEVPGGGDGVVRGLGLFCS